MEAKWPGATFSRRTSFFKPIGPSSCSYVVEALARPGTVEKASLDSGRAFLDRLKGHVREDSEPGVYTWREIAQGNYAEIELQALAPSTMTLHWMKVLRNS